MSINEVKEKLKNKELTQETKNLYLEKLNRIRDKIQEISLFSYELFKLDQSFFIEYSTELIDYALSLRKPENRDVIYSRALDFKGEFLLYKNQIDESIDLFEQSIKCYQYNNSAGINLLYANLIKNNFEYSIELEDAFNKYHEIDEDLTVLEIGFTNSRLTYYITKKIVLEDKNIIDNAVDEEIVKLQQGILPQDFLDFMKKKNLDKKIVTDEKLKKFKVDY